MLDATEISVTRPHTRASASRAALDYLQASGAAAISVIADADGVAISVGLKLDAVSVFWLPAGEAIAVTRRARTIAGGDVDVEGMIAALTESAAHHRATLTEHTVAVARADEAAKKLDAYLAHLRACGGMAEFLQQYKARRIAAAARGKGFMSFATAMSRLKRELVLLLMNGGEPKVGPSLFARIFTEK